VIKMEAGRFNQRVTIQQQASATSSLGFAKGGSWSTFATLWAHVMAPLGSELVSGKADTEERKISVVIRHNNGVTPAMKLVWQGDDYHITTVVHYKSVNETRIAASYVQGKV